MQLREERGTYRLKRSNCIWPRCSIIYRDTAVRWAYGLIDHLWDTLVGTVACAEVDIGGPVVGEVLVEGAGGAGGEFGDICDGHASVEGVLGQGISTRLERSRERVMGETYTADDLVNVG